MDRWGLLHSEDATFLTPFVQDHEDDLARLETRLNRRHPLVGGHVRPPSPSATPKVRRALSGPWRNPTADSMASIRSLISTACANSRATRAADTRAPGAAPASAMTSISASTALLPAEQMRALTCSRRARFS